MPDTGAPWNITYVAASDLVKDWPTDNQTMAQSVSDALDSVFGQIGVGQVVSGYKSTTFSTASTTFTDLTGLSATITPTAATSQVLVVVSLGEIDSNGTNYAKFQVERDATPIGLGGGTDAGWYELLANQRPQANAWTFLDSPASVSATTYQVQAATSGGTLYVNRDAANARNASSSITLFEVLA